MVQKLAPPVEPPRRFYHAVSIAEAQGGLAVQLDGKPARTPGGRPLRAPTPALARMLAEEWDAQAVHIDMGRMAATRLAFTAIDFVSGARDATAAQIARYAASDALCYFAEGPQALVERQVRSWGPVLQWAQKDLGLHFVRAMGVAHREQPAETLLRVARLAERGDDFVLAGLAHATALFGSAILAFGLQRGQLDAEAAFALARLEQAFQEERWGVDEEAAERTAGLAAEAAMLQRWFRALEGSGAAEP